VELPQQTGSLEVELPLQRRVGHCVLCRIATVRVDLKQGLHDQDAPAHETQGRFLHCQDVGACAPGVLQRLGGRGLQRQQPAGPTRILCEQPLVQEHRKQREVHEEWDLQQAVFGPALHK